MGLSTVLSKLVILGLLVEQPLHGYGVEKLIKERRIHHVTPNGRKLWATSTLEALVEVGDSDSGFLIALSCLPQLEPRDVSSALEQRRSLLESQIASLDADLNALLPAPKHVDSMFSYARARLCASLAWLNEYLSVSPDPTKEASP